MNRRPALSPWVFAVPVVAFLAAAPACTNRVGRLGGAASSSRAGTRVSANDLRIIVSEPQAVELAERESPEQAASRYARLGELLLLPEGLLHSDNMFDKALASDPRNAKACFYGALTKIAIAFAGAVPLLERVAVDDEAEALASIRRAADRAGIPELRALITTLPRGRSPFENREQVRSHLDDEVLPVLLDSLRRLERAHARAPFMLTIDAQRLRVAANPVTRVLGRSAEDCRFSEGDGWTCAVDPAAGLPEPVTVEPGDVARVRDAVEALADELRSGSNPERSPDLARIFGLASGAYREALAVLDGT